MTAVHADETACFPSFRDLRAVRGGAARARGRRLRIAVAYSGRHDPGAASGADMLGQAQTGTGKTAAFALPALTRLDLAGRDPQVLVLVPTRELALQVAEAFQRYAAHLPGFHVLPIYGGQSYQPQLNALRRGVHVVVGTPGRVIDHMNRGTLNLANSRCWYSMRRTRCCRWASSKRSRAFSSRLRRGARWPCSRPPWPPRSAASRRSICARPSK